MRYIVTPEPGARRPAPAGAARAPGTREWHAGADCAPARAHTRHEPVVYPRSPACFRRRCSLWPLRSELSLLLHAQGWSQLYSFSLGNLVRAAKKRIETGTAAAVARDELESTVVLGWEISGGCGREGGQRDYKVSRVACMVVGGSRGRTRRAGGAGGAGGGRQGSSVRGRCCGRQGSDGTTNATGLMGVGPGRACCNADAAAHAARQLPLQPGAPRSLAPGAHSAGVYRKTRCGAPLCPFTVPSLPQDVLILAVAKQLALILATPSRRRARGGGAPLESNHQQVCRTMYRAVPASTWEHSEETGYNWYRTWRPGVHGRIGAPVRYALSRTASSRARNRANASLLRPCLSSFLNTQHSTAHAPFIVNLAHTQLTRTQTHNKRVTNAQASVARSRPRPLQVRTAIGVMCLAHATLLLVKAAAVAVTAPDDLWPAAPPHPPGGAAGGRVVVGLVYMYASIGEWLLQSTAGAGRGCSSPRWLWLAASHGRL